MANNEKNDDYIPESDESENNFYASEDKTPVFETAKGTVTKDRLLIEAAIMFARKGFSATSIKDIASKIGIKTASIYNHYLSKDALIEEVLLKTEHIYIEYHEYLRIRFKECTEIKQLFRRILEERQKMRNEFTVYGLSLVISERYANDTAWRIYRDVFYKDSVDVLGSALKRLGYRGDADLVALILLDISLFAVQMSTNQLMGNEIDFSSKDLMDRLENFLNSIT
jgi:AcrR family transcriptional regulator